MEIVMSIVAKIAELTVEPIGRQLGYLFCFKSNVENIQEKVENLGDERSRVQHCVEEAKRNGEEIEDDVKKWFEKVDEIATKTKELFQPKVSCLNLWSRYQLSKKAKKMTLIVDEIQKAGKFDRVSYEPAPLGIATIASTRDYESLKSRISVLHEIMDALRKDDIHMIGVYGMGGVGKTTLVKEVARQAQEGKLFDAVVMTAVTQNPDVRKIQEEIADALGLNFKEQSDAGRANRLFKRIEKEEKKILIILDDLWKVLDLNEVGVPSGNDCKGCNILLTSRSRDVLSNQMGCQLSIPVDILRKEEAWQLFKKMAGECVESYDLQSTAIMVSKQCSGLPVAIVTVARALKDKTLPEWKSALRQLQMPNVPDVVEIPKDVYSALQLSYDYLKSEELKSIFLLCGLMGYRAAISDLLKYCFGLCLLKGVYSIEEAQDEVYTLVEQLKASCLLLSSDSNEWFMMHDVVRDVAIYIASRDQHVFTVRKDKIKKWPDNDQLKNCTKISLRCCDVKVLPEGLECPNLVFFYMSSKNSSIKIPDTFFQGLCSLRVLDLTGMRFSSLPSSLILLTNLQTLCLDQCKLGDDIDLIGGLKNLKILSLMNSDLKHLPRVIGELTHLLLLDLSECSYLRVIPPNVISRLKNLEQLHVGSNFVEWEIEGLKNASLSELKHLPNLTALDVRVRDATILPKDLYFMKLKRYKISIGDDWKWYDDEETSRILKLKFSADYHSQLGVKMLLNNVENLYLDELNGVNNILYELNSEGFPQLKHLHVQKNGEIQHIINFMDWQVNHPCSAFVILESLSLSHISNLENICHGLPTGTSFCKLRSIKVELCHRLKNLFLVSFAKGLLQLQEINIDDCQCMEEIVVEQGEEDANNNVAIQNIEFRQLRTLKLGGLPRLIGFYVSQRSEKQLIADMGSKEFISRDELGTPMYLFNEKVAFPNIENMKIHHMHNLRMIWHNQLVLHHSFCKLMKLTVKFCDSLKSLCSISMTKHLLQLEKLKISHCKALEDIVVKEKGLDIDPNKFMFPQLTFLELDNLPELKSFYPVKHTLEWPFLKVLKINGCNKVKMFVSDSTTLHLDITIQRPLFRIKKDTFANLEELKLEWNNAMNKTWHGQFPAEFFRKLKVLDLHFSNSESPVFAASFVHGLSNLEQLTLSGNLIEEICLYNGRFPISVTYLILYSMPKLMHWWNEDSQTGKAFQNLEILYVSFCGGLKNLEPFLISLQNLKALYVQKCNGLINLVTSSAAKSLVQLREMTISCCENITEIVANEGGEVGDPEIVFSQLTYLALLDLPRLTSFHPGNRTMKFTFLDYITVRDCPELKFFSQGVLSTSMLSTLVILDSTSFLPLGNTSFYPERDDLNSSIKQAWEWFNNKKVDTGKEDNEKHNMGDHLELEDTQEQAKNSTSNYEEHDKDDDSESDYSKLEESKEQVENNASNC